MNVETLNMNTPADVPPLTPINQPETQAQANARVARATGILALGNIASRILGLLREIVLSNLFGASAAAAAYKVAILVPKGLYDLLIGGHVNGAIIPVLSEVVIVKGRDELWQLVSVLMSMFTLILSVLVLVLQFAAPVLVDIFGGGLNLSTQALAVDLLRITSPALIFMGIFAILSATLYAVRVFTWPAFATAIFNLTIVIVAVLFTPQPRFTAVINGFDVNWAFIRPNEGIVVMAIGWLLGSMAYMLLQLPGLRDARLIPTMHWRHPAIRQIGVLYVPVMFSLIMDTLIIRPFSYNLASQTGASSIPYMELATTLIQFPHGLVATAISIAILPTLSRQAALILKPADQANKDDHDKMFKNTLGLGLRLAITLILPATIGLLVLAHPIIALIFEHGAFTPDDTIITVRVLRFYLIGLPFAAVDLLLIYAFYAQQDTLTPALIGLVSIFIYMLVALLLLPRYGLFSLMMADSTKHIAHATLSGYLLHRQLGDMGDQRLVITATKTTIAAVGMGTAAYVMLQVAGDAQVGLLQEATIVLLCGGMSSVVFIGLSYLLKIEEWHWLITLIKKRLMG